MGSGGGRSFLFPDLIVMIGERKAGGAAGLAAGKGRNGVKDPMKRLSFLASGSGTNSWFTINHEFVPEPDSWYKE